MPRDCWVEDWEREAIVDWCAEYPLPGYRRCCYMMMDAGLVAASPSPRFRTLADSDLPEVPRSDGAEDLG